jgi:hypothetical protein
MLVVQCCQTVESGTMGLTPVEIGAEHYHNRLQFMKARCLDIVPIRK